MARLHAHIALNMRQIAFGAFGALPKRGLKQTWLFNPLPL
jgi:hypothetical protein